MYNVEINVPVPTGLKTKSGRDVFIGETISIRKTTGISEIAHLFRKGVIDSCLVKFEKHPKYYGMVLGITPLKNGNRISGKAAKEISIKELDNFSKSYQKKLLEPYYEKANAIVYKFLDELQDESDFELIEIVEQNQEIVSYLDKEDK